MALMTAVFVFVLSATSGEWKPSSKGEASMKEKFIDPKEKPA